MSNETATPTTTNTAHVETASSAGSGYSFSSSTIVRAAIAAGIIVLVICALLLAMKISSWVRFRNRLRREQALRKIQENEHKAHAFELAAWSDTPGQAPVTDGPNNSNNSWWKRTKTVKNTRMMIRGRVNAYAVYEWEGVPA
ncbi:uncharacterized protein EHS24_007756 [Apiotrichum porosum]|uniref:Uncharacterized protein n=1 Tax=Apiotrichum porosum TaxID=105984 RepID=A0A427XVA4_9TREE|nr:uncharacterized protein EHS24_007756 [Apiotrichum porosum]RSH82762.1 hypothetical protein EHS24_007756 [Apiotrichum porosum]